MTVSLTPSFMACRKHLQQREWDSIQTTLMQFWENPDLPGLRLHKLKAREGEVYSISDTMDLRIILVKEGAHWIAVYADHHDAAYRWAERRAFARHGHTGVFQMIEVEETVKNVERVIERPVLAEAPPLFAGETDDYLRSLGVPELWLPTVRRVRDEDQLLTVVAHLPEDVAVRLLDLATGAFVLPPEPVTAASEVGLYAPASATELELLLRAPMAQWLAFLHPDQRYLVTRDFAGPFSVRGSAGTGKTVVALHRARRLARQGVAVLLTTFTNALVGNLQRQLALLCSADELARITVSTVHSQALALMVRANPKVKLAGAAEMKSLLEALALRFASGYDPKFVRAEWEQVVRLQGIERWEDYRRARRTGRGQGLGIKERKQLWAVFGGVLERLAERQRYDWTGMCSGAVALLRSGQLVSPYGAVIVDEVQDLRPAELRMVKALARDPGQLMLCGDVGQRIYAGGFSLGALGLETRGRSKVLRVNYRTTAQIRATADRLLSGLDQDDMEGGQETRGTAVALRQGPAPLLQGYGTEREELAANLDQVRQWLAEGLEPHAIGLFARNNADLESLAAVLRQQGLESVFLADREAALHGRIALGTMHLAKGLEFKAVLIHGVSAQKCPGAYVYSFSDPLDRQHAMAQERSLLYVAMTRARDLLTVTWSGEPSPFLG